MLVIANVTMWKDICDSVPKTTTEHNYCENIVDKWKAKMTTLQSTEDKLT